MNDMSSFLPARCCAGVGTSYGHVCLSVCVCPSVHYKVGVLLKQANESSWVFLARELPSTLCYKKLSYRRGTA